MSLAEVVDDLLALEALAAHEDDPERRRSLEIVRGHLVERDQGAKVSEAARVLGLSQPTIRAWIESGVLTKVADSSPVRIKVQSLATIKRAVDLLRQHRDDRHFLIRVMRILRDEAALEDSEEGLADYRAGRVAPIGDDLRAEIDQLKKADKSRSKSH